MKYNFALLLILAAITAHAQTVSKYICIDQFGYRPASDKVAVIRDPQTGWELRTNNRATAAGGSTSAASPLLALTIFWMLPKM